MSLSLSATTSHSKPLDSSGHSWAGAMLVLVTLLVFAPICRHDFVRWDDWRTIRNNPRILDPSAANTLHGWLHPHMGLYVPVTYTAWSALAVFAREQQTDGSAALNPAIFHAASVAVHAVNVLFVYLILRLLLPHAPGAWMAPAAGAMLFALHPLQVETVAWASGLKDLLCGTFSLLALWQYLLFARKSIESNEHAHAKSHANYWIATAALALAMLSKPTAVAVPLLALVLDVLVVRRPISRSVNALWPWFVLAVPCLIWTKLFQSGESVPATPLWARPLIAGDALAFYLAKLLAPFNLTVDYGRTPSAVLQNGWVYVAWIIPAAIASALWIGRKRFTLPGAAALLVVIPLAPVLGFTPFMFQRYSTVADHYLYLPLLGVALAGARLATRYPGRVTNAACVALLALLAARTLDQERHWADSEALFLHVLAINPASDAGYTNLAFEEDARGQALMRAAMEGAAQGRTEQAMAQRAQAAEKFQQAEALYRTAVERTPGQLAARHGLAVLLLRTGRFPEAAEQFARIVHDRSRLAPADQSTFYDDSDLLGQALLRAGRPVEAAEAFRDLLRLQPDSPDAQRHLQAALAQIAKTSAPAPTASGRDE